MTSPHANMLGLYYLPVLYLAHETGLGLEGASKGLKRAVEAGFCSYDHDAEMVWVHEMAAWQVGETLKPGDNRCAGVRNEYASLPENAFLSVFYDRYKTDFHLDVRRNNSRNSVRGFEGASKGLLRGFEAKNRNRSRRKNRNRTKTLWFMAKKHHEPGRGCSDRQSWSASRHDTGSRFGRCAAGDDRRVGAITPTAAA